MVYGQSFTCPESNGECEIGTYPDPTSCVHFYECAPGLESECITVRHQCPELMAFHRILLQCVLAIDADCPRKCLCQPVVAILFVTFMINQCMGEDSCKCMNEQNVTLYLQLMVTV